MKKLETLGRSLSRAEQKNVIGGFNPPCVALNGACTLTSQCCFNMLICGNPPSGSACTAGPTACNEGRCINV